MNCTAYDGVIYPHWMCCMYDSIVISIIVLIVLCLNPTH